MLKEFESNILKNSLFNKQQKLLLAVSGGVDSVVLAHLLKKAKFNFALAHCNFKLRGKDSDADEKFCNALANDLKVEIFTKHFDVIKHCKEKKQSVQMVARNLRYTFFTELLQKEKFDYVLTAHHANDNIETVLINLLRGTGITGLTGIPQKNASTVRPLLGFLRSDIENYANKNKLKFRLDKSNLDDKYERNFLRLNVIPLLKKINPSIENTFIKNTGNFRQEAAIVKSYLSQKAYETVSIKEDGISINKAKLKQERNIDTLLHFIIGVNGFSETQQKNIVENVLSEGEVGKIFISATHKLTIDRNEIIVKKKGSELIDRVEVKSLNQLKKHFGIRVQNKFVIPSKNELLVEEKKLVFPLIIRGKQTGDKFRPFGMKGFKLLSDFLKDEKLNSFEKEKVQLLVNGNGEIIWVVGYRSDDRYKVKKESKSILKLKQIG